MNRGESEAGELVEILECRPGRNGEEVHVVSGGWMSGPSLDADLTPADWPETEYGNNIVRLMNDYTDFVILGDAHGWTAYTRGKRSRAVGPGTHATSLDELAALMNAVRRRMDGV
ncbi:MAG: hypothetical protein ACRDRJ_03080 [Streptosporangiaceae bacterium]